MKDLVMAYSCATLVLAGAAVMDYRPGLGVTIAVLGALVIPWASGALKWRCA